MSLVAAGLVVGHGMAHVFHIGINKYLIKNNVKIGRYERIKNVHLTICHANQSPLTVVQPDLFWAPQPN